MSLSLLQSHSPPSFFRHLHLTRSFPFRSFAYFIPSFAPYFLVSPSFLSFPLSVCHSHSVPLSASIPRNFCESSSKFLLQLLSPSKNSHFLSFLLGRSHSLSIPTALSHSLSPHLDFSFPLAILYYLLSSFLLNVLAHPSIFSLNLFCLKVSLSSHLVLSLSTIRALSPSILLFTHRQLLTLSLFIFPNLSLSSALSPLFLAIAFRLSHLPLILYYA